jgi:hypothetical protein
MLETQQVTLDSKTQTFDFSLTFNQLPDFTTVEPSGRPAESFQVNFDGNYVPGSGNAYNYNNLTGIVRGDEIHIAGNLPIRSATGNGGPNSGGWGPLVDTVPFSLVGDTVSFSVPGTALGWTGHDYQYSVFSLADGAATATQTGTMVPTPRAFFAGLAGLIMVGGASRVVRKRHGLAM